MAGLGSRLAPLSNWFAGFAPIRIAMEKVIGLDRRRKLPGFAGRSLVRRAAVHRKTRRQTERPGNAPALEKAALVADVYTNYLKPDAGMAALDVLEESTELVDRLWENTHYFKAEMKRLGFDTGLSTTPITPIMLGEAPLAQQFSQELFEAGVFAMAIGFPTVPRGKARIRVMISAAHSRQDLDTGLEVFSVVGRKLGVIR